MTFITVIHSSDFPDKVRVNLSGTFVGDLSDGNITNMAIIETNMLQTDTIEPVQGSNVTVAGDLVVTGILYVNKFSNLNVTCITSTTAEVCANDNNVAMSINGVEYFKLNDGGRLELGNTTSALGNFSIASGAQSLANNYGQWSHSSGSFSVPGDSQSNFYHIFTSQIGAGSDILTFGDFSKPTIPLDHSWCGELYIIAKDATTNDSYSEKLFFHADNVSGTINIIVIENTYYGTGTLVDASVGLSSTGGNLNITGVSIGHSNTIHWTATMRVSQIG